MSGDSHKIRSENDDPSSTSRPERPSTWVMVAGSAGLVCVVVAVVFGMFRRPDEPLGGGPTDMILYNRSDKGTANPRYLALWWGGVPKRVEAISSKSGTTTSNIHPQDYAGPESCQECHPRKYRGWSQHPHRWMNALADKSTVKGDFADRTISYLGGVGTFYEEAGEYRMKLAREETRTFAIHQTLGSRFFQYYIGKQISGPELPNGRSNAEDHVLPFGYWLEPGEWVPVVHIFEEHPDGERLDPFDADSYSQEFAMYAESCSVCHTTFPLGDLLSKDVKQMAREVPVNLHWSASDYLHEQRADWLLGPTDIDSDEELNQLLSTLKRKDAPTHAVTLGISCEACHLGAREHVNNPKKPPKFFPHSAHLRVESDAAIDFGKTHDNLNWTCGRCHSGARPQFAAGMSTWNSTEYSDAMRGSCYSELRCIDCHDPHQPIGQKWSRTPAQNDALCFRCHQQYQTAEAQAAHSHHPAGSEGSRCMNCHMPRLNEGMQDIVRTHTIFSPTEPEMLHVNHPNACNQCHTEETIDWTLTFLRKWYNKTYDSQRLARTYENRQQPAALGWLQSDNESVRLVGADSLFRSDAKWALSDLLNALDDRYLLNRQFARRGLEEMLGLHLEDYGYRFYMTAEERDKPIDRLRAALLNDIPTDRPSAEASRSSGASDVGEN